MYAPGPSEAELKAIGITRADVQDDSITDIWPENYEAFSIFARCSTQWNVGPGGPVGLNYPTVALLCDTFGVKKKRKPEVFDAIQTLEREALNQMNTKD